jgi:hypothetical protein
MYKEQYFLYMISGSCKETMHDVPDYFPAELFSNCHCLPARSRFGIGRRASNINE